LTKGCHNDAFFYCLCDIILITVCLIAKCTIAADLHS
jgi:hypothetical protein